MEARSVIEGELLTPACARMTPATLTRLREILKDMEAATEAATTRWIGD